MTITWEWPFDRKVYKDFSAWRWSIGVWRYGQNIYIDLLIGTVCIELKRRHA